MGRTATPVVGDDKLWPAQKGTPLDPPRLRVSNSRWGCSWRLLRYPALRLVARAPNPREIWALAMTKALGLDELIFGSLPQSFCPSVDGVGAWLGTENGFFFF